MRYKLMVALCLLALAGPLAATEYMEVLGPGPLMNDTTLWFEITGDMPGCDNTSGYWNQNGDLVGGVGYDNIDCWEWSSNSPRAVDQDCGSGNCTVSATVYCPYLHPETRQWVTFTCSGSAAAGVRSGELGTTSTYVKKGVRCGNVECGCIIWKCNGSNGPCPYAEFFGSPQMMGGNSANYVCQ